MYGSMQFLENKFPRIRLTLSASRSLLGSHLKVSSCDTGSEMCSTVRAVLTSLEIEGAAIFASDLDDLPKDLCVSWSRFRFLLEPSHSSHHYEHYSDQHYEERDSDSKEIRSIQHYNQYREDEQEESSEARHLRVCCSRLL